MMLSNFENSQVITVIIYMKRFSFYHSSASGGHNPPSPRRGGICHYDFLIDYTLGHLQKMFTRDLLVVLPEIAILKGRDFAYINIYKLSPLHRKLESSVHILTIQAYEHNYLADLLLNIFYKRYNMLICYLPIKSV